MPDKERYLVSESGIAGYPTHIILNKRGVVEKVIQGSVNEFVAALNSVKK
ncbi:MAG TPA: hypothetical protein VFS22_03655 [Flavisolibacter sp.]|nr:hypothetical protein [Flavisolibacter sp.]